tara:strand:+ start:222 stop:485 length:264 start_codon:yes stop_codon:yes gene_type:complete
MKSKKFKDTFVTKSGETIDMDIEEIARWSCLIEAVDIISNKGSQIGINMEEKNWVKPIAIQKYIDERHDTMIEEIEHDQNNHPITIL